MKNGNIIVKCCFSVFLLNLFVLSSAFSFSIPHCTQITNIISISVIFLEMLNDSNITKTVLRISKPMVIYLAYIALSGVILVLIGDYDLSLIFAFVEKIIVVITVAYIVYKDKSIEYILWLSIVIALILSLYSISNSNSLLTRFRLSENVSENTAGLIFTFGIISTFLSKSKCLNKYVKATLNLIFISAIVLTASRQALVLVGVTYFGWIVRSCLNKEKTITIHFKDIVFVYVCIIAAFVLINGGVLEVLTHTKLYLRLIGESRSTTISDGERLNLYSIGLKEFVKSPVIGCGFNNLEKYTHSTYMEVLGGTGFIGFVLFYYPFILKISGAFKLYKQDLSKRVEAVEILTLLAVIFVMMLTRAIHYYIISMIIVALIFSDTNQLELSSNTVIGGEKNEIRTNS